VDERYPVGAGVAWSCPRYPALARAGIRNQKS
jgi:hypothetical protein